MSVNQQPLLSSEPHLAREPLVVGLGSPGRGDDAVGLSVARAVGALGLGRVRVVEQEDPTALLDLWAGCELAVVVDAVHAGCPPGALVTVETGCAQAPLPEGAWALPGQGGTHAFGLGATVELARALHRLPRRVVVVGIEAAAFEHGQPLSVPVAGAVAAAVDAVVSVLREGATWAEECPDDDG